MQDTIPFFTSKELQWRDLMGPEKHILLGKINLPEVVPELPNVHNI